MAAYEELPELVAAVRAGDIDESQLLVMMDNDASYVMYEGPVSDLPIGDDACLWKGNGDYDVNELWPLVFPKAAVEHV